MNEYSVVTVFVSSILTLQQNIQTMIEKYNELFEVLVELYEGLEIGIEENDYSDFLNDRTYDEMKKI
jgi:hypothetical protein